MAQMDEFEPLIEIWLVMLPETSRTGAAVCPDEFHDEEKKVQGDHINKNRETKKHVCISGCVKFMSIWLPLVFLYTDCKIDRHGLII